MTEPVSFNNIAPPWRSLFAKFLLKNDCYQEWFQIYSDRTQWATHIGSTPSSLIGAMVGYNLILGREFWESRFDEWIGEIKEVHKTLKNK